MRILSAAALLAAALLTNGCGGGGSSTPSPVVQQSSPAGPSAVPSATASPTTPATSGPTATPIPSSSPQTQSCAASGTAAPQAPGPPPAPANGLSVPPGFTIEVIGNVYGARELAFAPNGDLFVGSTGSHVYIIRNAEGQPSKSAVFASLNDSPAAGVALSLSASNCAVYVGTQFGVYRIAYAIGDAVARSAPVKIAGVRPGGSSDHSTTSVAVAGGELYASVGSSCNACTETDPTRATIQRMGLDGSGMTAKAVHIRNAIALTVNPSTQTVWAGDAGQDALPEGHPYEFFDGVTLHSGTPNYGWPDCEENQHAYAAGANCSGTVVPGVVFPAYETPIGAAFYPSNPTGAYAFPMQYRGGAFVAMHGSWHSSGGKYVSPPRVAFVPMSGDSPKTGVTWTDPTKQWSTFVAGFQLSDGVTRIGRPTGVAVGPSGSLFVADDQTGNIYRIRP